MATDYGARFSKGVGCTRHAMGGAAEGLGIEALAGDTEMVTVFDDFNSIVKGTEGFGDAAVWPDLGLIGTDAGLVAGDEIYMNDISNTDTYYSSEFIIYAGTVNDTGGSYQWDLINGAIANITGMHNFQYMWLPDTTAAGAAINDNTTWVFAVRIGFQSTQSDGDWDSKVFIGWAEAGDTGIMDVGTGAITVANDGPLVGFHIPEDGSIDGISRRTVGATAFADGTDFTELAPAGTVDGEDETSKMWFDLAWKLDIVDSSEATGNGFTNFYWRRVLPNQPLGDWLHHSVTLVDQVPHNTPALVPTIEVINGPSAGGVAGCAVGLDWWVWARNRLNR